MFDGSVMADHGDDGDNDGDVKNYDGDDSDNDAIGDDCDIDYDYLMIITIIITKELLQ